MELIEMFGINPMLLIAQIVNFLVILYLLKRFMYKPVLKTLKERQVKIKEGIENAEKAQALIEKTKAEEKAVLKKASQEANKLLAEVKAQAQEQAKEQEEKAKRQTEKMIEEARAQIVKESRETEARMVKNISELAVSMLEHALQGVVSEEEQDEIVKKAVKNFNKKPN